MQQLPPTIGKCSRPQLGEDWRERLAGEKAKQEKQQELKEQREAQERMQQAKRRRMY